jgi:hypothetical protein
MIKGWCLVTSQLQHSFRHYPLWRVARGPFNRCIDANWRSWPITTLTLLIDAMLETIDGMVLPGNDLICFLDHQVASIISCHGSVFRLNLS